MKSIIMTVGAALLLLALSGPAQADDDDDDDARRGGWHGGPLRRHDQDRVRHGVLSGDILPLSAILDRVERDHPGDLIEAELENHHGRPVYELKLVTPDGRLLKLRYDARDGARLKAREER